MWIWLQKVSGFCSASIWLDTLLSSIQVPYSLPSDGGGGEGACPATPSAANKLRTDDPMSPIFPSCSYLISFCISISISPNLSLFFIREDRQTGG